MKIEDVTPYVYDEPLFKGELAVGWLDGDSIESTGLIEPKQVRSLIIDRLVFAAGYLQSGTAHWMGTHQCSYCDGPDTPLRSDGRALWGNGEFRIRDSKGTVYVAPTLIGHYVEAHQYLPPKEFLDALWLGDFVEQKIDLPPFNIVMSAEEAPTDVCNAFGDEVKVVLLERDLSNGEAPRPMLALQHEKWVVHGPWDGSISHANELRHQEPIPCVYSW